MVLNFLGQAPGRGREVFGGGDSAGDQSCRAGAGSAQPPIGRRDSTRLTQIIIIVEPPGFAELQMCPTVQLESFFQKLHFHTIKLWPGKSS